MANLLKLIKEELAKLDVNNLKGRIKAEYFTDGSLTVMIDGDDILIVGNSRSGF